jgi:hypothetical protein
MKFIDPPEDDDPTIIEECSLTSLWRLEIHDKRLSQIIELEPSLVKIALAFKNTFTGCWIAFTGKRIASKIENSLNAQGIEAELTNCDVEGNLIET